jgi:hypothetical protein
VLSTRKSKLAAVGAAGVFGALAFGGIAYAVGGEDAARPQYVTVVDQPGSGESSEAPRGGSGDQPRGDGRDCPEKNGGQSNGGQSNGGQGESEAPSESPSTPSEQEPTPGSAGDL